MGKRIVSFCHSVDIDIKAEITWEDPHPSRYESYEDTREVEELRGATKEDDAILQTVLEVTPNTDDIYSLAIEAHDDLCRWEQENDGYNIAIKRVMEIARECTKSADRRQLETVADRLRKWRKEQKAKYDPRRLRPFPATMDEILEQNTELEEKEAEEHASAMFLLQHGPRLAKLRDTLRATGDGKAEEKTSG